MSLITFFTAGNAPCKYYKYRVANFAQQLPRDNTCQRGDSLRSGCFKLNADLTEFVKKRQIICSRFFRSPAAHNCEERSMLRIMGLLCYCIVARVSVAYIT